MKTTVRVELIILTWSQLMTKEVCEKWKAIEFFRWLEVQLQLKLSRDISKVATHEK